jgi:predicted transcriptional regulator
MAPVKTVHPDLALATVLERMACEHELVVVDGERPIGLVTRKTVLGFLDARMDASTALMAAPSASASDRVAS